LRVISRPKSPLCHSPPPCNSPPVRETSSTFSAFDIVGQDHKSRFPWQRDVGIQCSILPARPLVWPPAPRIQVEDTDPDTPDSITIEVHDYCNGTKEPERARTVWPPEHRPPDRRPSGGIAMRPQTLIPVMPGCRIMATSDMALYQGRRPSRHDPVSPAVLEGASVSMVQIPTIDIEDEDPPP